MTCNCGTDEMCIVCHEEKKECCYDLPIGQHYKSCDDDERGDQGRQYQRDEELEEEHDYM